ncbi:MAG: phosphopentomutase [Pseudomonadota bacterium]
MPRAFLLVMDSVGIGGAPDAARFGDAGADTVGHIAQACAAGRCEEGRTGPLHLPNLSALGLGEAARLASGAAPPGLGPHRQGVWAVGEEVSPGKDTITGHWELAGAPLGEAWHYFPKTVPALPRALTDRLIAEFGLPGVLGDRHASGTEILEELGEESLRTGRPILYTSADSVLQIAAHEEAFGLERLYALCAGARAALDEMGLRVGRVIARPFLGRAAGEFVRTANRHDYAVPPPEPTLCDRVRAAGGRTIAVGKIEDIMAGQGVSESLKGPDDMALFDRCLEAMREGRDGDFLFANFVEFDSLYGHRRDVCGYARALEAFDARLPEALAALRPGDLMIVTADHGNDPTWRGTDHTRERVPMLCAGPEVEPGSAGLRAFADAAGTLARHLGLPPGAHGASFLTRGPEGRLRAEAARGAGDIRGNRR